MSRDALIFLDSPRNGQLPDFCSCMLLFPLGRDQISDLDRTVGRLFTSIHSLFHILFFFVELVHTQL